MHVIAVVFSIPLIPFMYLPLNQTSMDDVRYTGYLRVLHINGLIHHFQSLLIDVAKFYSFSDIYFLAYYSRVKQTQLLEIMIF